MDILDLQGHLDELSAWRKDELSLARSLAEDAADSATRRYLCRAWTLMLYAHCDNFLKKAIKYYVEYIKEYTPNEYRIDAMWLMFNAKDNVKYASEAYVCHFDHGRNVETYFSAITSDAVINGRSFSYKSLRFFCDWVLQIKFPHYEKKWFCDSLKNKRDAIAHGEESYIDDIRDCIKWHEETIRFMDDLKDSILLNALTKRDDSA